MKPYLPTLFVTGAMACTGAYATELTVKVTDIRTFKGNVAIAVIDSETNWSPQGKPVAVQSVAATGSEVTFHFADLPPGAYALQVMHDENGNGKLDTNLLGVPTEGYGFSNNPQVMRRARFDEARFKLDGASATLVVRLR
jgi:uncharacterized protein (DUF2141 family)